MNRLLVAVTMCFILLPGCDAPDPPQSEVPPELTPEIAKQALIEMVRIDPNTLPFVRPETLATSAVETDGDDYASIGGFGVELRKRTWHITFGDQTAGYRYSGDFIQVDRSWVARLNLKAHYHTPGRP